MIKNLKNRVVQFQLNSGTTDFLTAIHYMQLKI